MKVEILKATEGNEDRDALVITVDGKIAFSAFDGEPEDNSLCRNFGDCFNIGVLMEQAYFAGVGKEEFGIIDKELTWEELSELY